jgi:ABC-type sugar transport system ATPase subunit
MGDLLRTEHINRSFPGVLAVNDVSISLREGEVLALVGENGAGKSTLSQVLCGALRPDSGQIFLNDQEVSFVSLHEAMQAGIGMVFQELSLVGSLSVAENIFANRQPTGALNNIHWRDLMQMTADLLRKFQLDVTPSMLVKRLSMGRQQMVEVLKALSNNPKLLILDEPTSSLTEGEIAYLFGIINQLKAQGISFIYISHKLSEIFQISGRVAVLRDGKLIGVRDTREVTENDLVAMMVGRKIEDLYGRTRGAAEAPVYFRVESLSRAGVFHDLSFALHKGEILGFSGLVGAGRTEMARAIIGIDPKDSGRIFLNDRPIHIASPRDAIDHGIAYLTEDRKGQGLFLGLTIKENVVAPTLDRFTSAIGFLQGRKMDDYARRTVESFSIATPSIMQKVRNLSGGNQQKVMVAEWIGIRPQVLICDEPTRGVDVGAKAEIYRILRELASTGTGIIMISSDLPELIGMCDRILVMHDGEISGEVRRKDFSEERILSYAAGLSEANHNLGAGHDSQGGI